MVTPTAIWDVSSLRPMTRHPFIALIAFGLVAAVGAQPVGGRMPFESGRGLVLIQGRINGSRPLSFILDTGAGISVIDNSLIESLGLKEVGSTTAIGAGGAARAKSLEGAKLALDPLGEPVELPLIGLPIKGLEMQIGAPVDGILGRDLFDKYVITIDYRDRWVGFSKEPPAPGRGKVVPFKYERGIPVVEATVELSDGRKVVTTLGVDTGSTRGVTLYSGFTTENKVLPFPGASIETLSGGVGGMRASVLGRLNAVEFGGFRIARPIAQVNPTAVSGSAESADRGGLLGSEVFRKFRVVVDYPRNRLILEPNDDFDRAIETDMVGLGLTKTATHVRVTRVNPKSPAGEGGVKPGDVLVEVDGSSAPTLGLTALEELFRTEGKTYSLVFMRGQERRELKVTTRRLL